VLAVTEDLGRTEATCATTQKQKPAPGGSLGAGSSHTASLSAMPYNLPISGSTYSRLTTRASGGIDAGASSVIPYSDLTEQQHGSQQVKREWLAVLTIADQLRRKDAEMSLSYNINSTRALRSVGM
jgi:hypothetical protein